MEKYKLEILISILEGAKYKVNHRSDNDSIVRRVSYNAGIDSAIEVLNQVKEGHRELSND